MLTRGYIYRERGSGRERKRERNINMKHSDELPPINALTGD